MSATLRTYRHLLRAAQVAFHGDIPVLNAARQRIRDGFREKASISPSDPAIESALKHAEEVAQFLKTNVVQGKKEGDVYRLRIHKDIERGDNDTIKMPGGKTVRIDGRKCSDA
ncbi:hypothetical protein VTK73DRAFT_1017 [Phialemonium thermophilum]|uniref:Mitochondrial zinc maintenance protein 1, mitochondrial n=1 Tax=Phialemonium thermophilum TaxID=223376 RepID=A0ABR3XBT7_9PEZI